MQARILDFDASLTRQPSLQTALAAGTARRLEFRDLAAGMRLVARRDALKTLHSRLAEDERLHAARPCVDFYGSGDFHHVTAALLARFSEPLTVVHVDNHPDWVSWPRTFNCGGWINRALELPNVRRVITLGPCSRDLDWPELRLGNLQALASGRLELYPWRHEPSRVLGHYGVGRSHATQNRRIVWRNLADERWDLFVKGLIDAIPTDAVYVTIDKDAFSPTEAATNWDQGEMPLDHVLAVVAQLARSKRVVGADVCGDYSPPIFATIGRATLSWLDRGRGSREPPNAAALNDATNARLLGAFARCA